MTPTRKRGLTGRVIARYISTVSKTSSLVVDPPDARERFGETGPEIIAMWHGQFVLLPTANPAQNHKTDVIVARHGDAELIGGAMESFGIGLIRGAGAGERKGDRGGSAALKASLRALASGRHVGLTADVPPGPARRAGMGIVTMARLSGRPIRPVAMATNRFLAFDTWSRMTLNLPFSRIALAVGPPITIARDASPEVQERVRQQVETELNAVTERAYALAGGRLFRATPASAMPVDAPPLPIGVPLSIYRTVTRAFSPIVPLALFYRRSRGKEDGGRLSERLGRMTRERPAGRLVWFHASSVGETNAVLPIINGLLASRPGLNILLTTGTTTSAELARSRLPKAAIHQYVPVDTPGAVSRFLRHWQPELCVLTESEIWPNILIECSASKVPVVLVNARMSTRSFSRWRRMRGVANQLFSRFALVLAQNQRLARRFRSLGARNVKPIGNVKIDAPALPVNDDLLEVLQHQIGQRTVFLAASTHPGEDEIVLDAHRIITQRHPDALTIIAPRHPERGQSICDLARAQAFSAQMRSSGDSISEATEIYVADTIGELGLFYCLAPVAFVGGSLIRHGGQNPIEAVRRNTVVLNGPHVHNFTDSYRELIRQGGAIEVSDAPSLARAALKLLDSDFELQRAHQGAARALDSLSGALDKTLEELLSLLPDDAGLQRAC